MSYKFDDSSKYVKRVWYGDKCYYLSPYNKDNENYWKKKTFEKTNAYSKELIREERYKDTYGLTPGQYDFIENRL